MAKSAKLQLSCSKTSKTVRRISAGKQCQDIMLAVISDISVTIVNNDREKGRLMIWIDRTGDLASQTTIG